jgi:DNA polymerase III delta prime subunit
MKLDVNTAQDSCEVAQQRAFQTLSKLYDGKRFPHAILLLSNDLKLADTIVEHFAKKYLKCDDPRGHVDFFEINPIETGTQISADSVRKLIANIQTSPKIGKMKVAYLRNAETMNRYAANAFLKTLEEPPLDTVIFLATANQYELLPTILSRCLIFKLHSNVPRKSEILERITNLYESWLSMLNSRKNFNFVTIEMYRILSYVSEKLDELESEFKLELAKILVGNLERATNKFFRENTNILPKMCEITEIYEKNKYFLTLNCNIVAYLERCFILILRFFEKDLNRGDTHGS